MQSPQNGGFLFLRLKIHRTAAKGPEMFCFYVYRQKAFKPTFRGEAVGTTHKQSVQIIGATNRKTLKCYWTRFKSPHPDRTITVAHL